MLLLLPRLVEKGMRLGTAVAAVLAAARQHSSGWSTCTASASSTRSCSWRTAGGPGLGVCVVCAGSRRGLGPLCEALCVQVQTVQKKPVIPGSGCRVEGCTLSPETWVACQPEPVYTLPCLPLEILTAAPCCCLNPDCRPQHPHGSKPAPDGRHRQRCGGVCARI